MKNPICTGAKPDPATRPAVVAERRRMLAKRLAPAGLAIAKRVDFTCIVPMHQPVYVPPRPIAVRAGGEDFLAIESRGFRT
jgi:hypothetical protein